MEISTAIMDSFARKTKWVRIVLYVQVVFAVIMLWSDNLEYQLLSQFQSGAFASEDAMMSAANASDGRQQLVSAAYLLLFVISVIIIAMWIRNANRSARTLGAEDMEFSPAWSVGWYFIPFAHLWKPYQAMKEIWRASFPSNDWRMATTPAILPLWWFFWILNNIIGQASFRMSLRAEEIGELIDVSVTNQVFDVIEIPLALVFLAVVNSVYERQKSSVARIHGVTTDHLP